MCRLLSLLVPLAVALGASHMPMELAEVARLLYYPKHVYPCGDANGDESVEFYALGQGGGPWWEVFAIEYAAGAYDTVRLGLSRATVWVAGDADRDGLPDLILQDPTDTVLMCEASAPGLYPDTIVWSAGIPYTPAAMNATVCSLDGDSSQELVLRDGSGNVVWVFECTGDNTFEPVALLPRNCGPPLGMAATDDLDRDGKPEFAYGTDEGVVNFYEAYADNQYELVAACTLATSYFLDALTSTPDMDRDGRPELVVFGVDWSGNALLLVHESPGDNQFRAVDSHAFTGSYWSDHGIAAGDMDGDSVWEFAVTDGDSLRVFRCTGPDEYEQCWSTYTGKKEVGLYDINRDGHCELLYRYGNETVICQYVSGGIVANEVAQLRAVGVSPSVLRPGARLNLSGLPPDARVELLDVSGRVCFESGSAFILPPSPLSPGAYLVRITAGSHSITRKVLVVE